LADRLPSNHAYGYVEKHSTLRNIARGFLDFKITWTERGENSKREREIVSIKSSKLAINIPLSDTA
jgi:hypothetical protein